MAVDKRIHPARRKAVMSLRLGKKALYQQPLAPQGRWRRTLAAAGSGETWEQRVHSHTACMRCTQEAEDPYHVLTECPHGPTAAARAELIASLPTFIRQLARLAATAVAGGHTAPDSAGAAAAQALASVVQHTDWASAEGRFVLYRLLAASPWDAASMPTDESAPLAAALGAIFDNTIVKPHRIRPLANCWLEWAGRWVTRVVAAWFSGPAAPGEWGGDNAAPPLDADNGDASDCTDSDWSSSSWADTDSDSPSVYWWDEPPDNAWIEPDAEPEAADAAGYGAPPELQDRVRAGDGAAAPPPAAGIG
jgi:hypothetical protein